MDNAFIGQLTGMLGSCEAQKLIESLGDAPAVSIRVNNAKCRLQPTGGSVPWCGNGFYLDKRPQFTFDPLLHAGAYYVQDASSMFITHVLKQIARDKAVTYLDLCAAPGGKTTAALDALTDDSLIVSNEIDSQRAQILRENAVKWGRANCVVTNDTPRRLGRLRGFFDIVATDMPCSGEGMFRKDEEAVRQWSPSLVAQCAARQREIIADIWDALRPGGYLIYSTCTFNRQENEEIINHIIEEYGAETVEIAVNPDWNISPGIGTTAHCYRFMQHRTRGEGLFIAVLRKPGQYQGCAVKAKKGKILPVPKQCRSFVGEDSGIVLTAGGTEVTALPVAMAQKMEAVRQNAVTLLCGIPVSTIKGKDLIPQHALAISTIINRGEFPEIETDYNTAIAYLRGEAITPDADAPRGYCLVTYRGYPLGWIKNLGNRANNCYPKEWRIRSASTPATPPEVL